MSSRILSVAINSQLEGNYHFVANGCLLPRVCMCSRLGRVFGLSVFLFVCFLSVCPPLFGLFTH